LRLASRRFPFLSVLEFLGFAYQGIYHCGIYGYTNVSISVGVRDSIIRTAKLVYAMVNTAKVKLYEYESRHSINFPSDFVNDSTFPFKPKEELQARIEKDKVIIEKVSKK
jgi:acyl-CoA hydrolase